MLACVLTALVFIPAWTIHYLLLLLSLTRSSWSLLWISDSDWSHMPPIVSVVGDLLFGLGVFIMLLVFRGEYLRRRERRGC